MRSIGVRGGWLIAVLSLSILCVLTTPVQASQDMSSNQGIPLVVGQDTLADMERKLGPACVVPSVTSPVSSYLYRITHRGKASFLRLEVGEHLDAITLAHDPPLTGVCYAPMRQQGVVMTKKGIQLGMSKEQIRARYGRPSEEFTVGPLTRLRYAAYLDRPYEWSLVFRNDRLVEWSVSSEE